MKILFWIISISVLLLVVWIWGLSSPPSPVLGTEKVQSNSFSEPKLAIESKNKEIVLGSEIAVTKVDIEEFNPYETQEIKAQIQRVADSYAENIKYPIGSQPIYNPEDVRDFKPFEQAEVDVPFPQDVDDKNPIRIKAATNKYQYFLGDRIDVRVQILGAPADTFINVQGEMSSAKGYVPGELNFVAIDPTLSQFTASLDTQLVPSNSFTPEMVLELTVTVGAKELFTTVAFAYAQASAQIVAVQPSRVDGANLIIPVQFNVFQPGYYFIRAVLDDAKTGEPLVQLQNEGRLIQGNALIELNAHIAALKRQGSEGPYSLRSIISYRGAEQGEVNDVPASPLQYSFSVQGHAFTSYTNEEYVDPYGQERLDFLRGVGNAEQSSEIE